MLADRSSWSGNPSPSLGSETCFWRHRRLSYGLVVCRMPSSDDEDLLPSFKPAWAREGGIPKRAPAAAAPPPQQQRMMDPRSPPFPARVLREGWRPNSRRCRDPRSERPMQVRGEAERWPGAREENNRQQEADEPNAAGAVVVATGGDQVPLRPHTGSFRGPPCRFFLTSCQRGLPILPDAPRSGAQPTSLPLPAAPTC